MVIDKLRTAVFVSAFPELRSPELTEIRHSVARAITIAALFEDEAKLLGKEELLLAQPDYTSALIEAWKRTEHEVIGPGLVADFAAAERRLRVESYKGLSSRWGSLVVQGYQEASPTKDWELDRTPRIWRDTVHQVTPDGIPIPQFQENADTRDVHVAQLTLRSVAASGLQLEQTAIHDGSLGAENAAA